MTLAHPTITSSELAKLCLESGGTAAPASVIDLFAGSKQAPYRLIWLRGADGNQRLYRLIPDPEAPK